MSATRFGVGDTVRRKLDGRRGTVVEPYSWEGRDWVGVRIPELDGVDGCLEYVVYGDPGAFELEEPPVAEPRPAPRVDVVTYVGGSEG